MTRCHSEASHFRAEESRNGAKAARDCRDASRGVEMFRAGVGNAQHDNPGPESSYTNKKLNVSSLARKTSKDSGRGSAHAEALEAWGGVFQRAVSVSGTCV